MRKRFVGSLTCTLALLAALASSAVAAPRGTHFHTSFNDSNPADNVCGVDGSSVVNGVLNVQTAADGTSWAEIHFVYVFTSAATAKSIQISGSDRNGGTNTVNADGTVTAVSTFHGMPQKLSIDKGPVLSRDAGTITFVQTFDANGDLISQTVSSHGPHPSVADPNLFCDVLVPALG